MNQQKIRIATLVFLGFAIVFGLFARLWPIFSSPPEKLVTYTADDMYYYLGIVEHWVDDGSPSFDGEIKTNGFHPLYALLLRPIVRFTGHSIGRIQTALLMLVLFDCLAAFFLFLIMRRAGYPNAGRIAASIWLLMPFAIDICLSGMESSLVAACFGFCCFAFLGVRQNPQSGLSRLWFGISLALLFLSRTDSGWYVIILLGWLIFVDIFHRQDRTTFGRMLIAPFVSLVLVSPWLIWNKMAFGSFVQKSVISHIVRGQYTGAGEISVEGAALRDLKSLAFDLSHKTLLPILAIGLLLWILSLRLKKQESKKGLELSILILVATFFWYAFYWLVGLQPHLHYLAVPVMTAFIVATLILASQMARRFNAGKILETSAVVGFCCLLFVSLALGTYQRHFRTGLLFWQPSVYEAAKNVDKSLPPGARIAAFNAGLLGYFSGRYVLNIDGVVNPEAVSLFDDRRIERYLKKRRIDYLVDHALWLGVYQPAFGEPIAQNYEMLFQVSSPMFKNILCLKRKQ